MDTLKDGRRYATRNGMVLEAIIAVADADAEDNRAWHAAWVRFWQTLKRCGWEETRAFQPGTLETPDQMDLIPKETRESNDATRRT